MAASIKLTVASHHYKVEPRTQEAKEMLFEFTRRFLKVDFQGNVRSITTFAAANKSRSWFRFHINSLTEFYMFARNRNYLKEQMEIVVRPYIELAKVDLPVKEHWEVRVDQVPIVDYLTKPIAVDEPKAKLVGLQTGGGKAIPNDTLVKTPDGWVANKDLKVGDTIVAWDGTHSKVTGLFPQGLVEVCTMRFDDGRERVCSWDHLWRVYVSECPIPQVLTSRQMESLLYSGKGLRIDLHLAGTEEDKAAFAEAIKGKEDPHLSYRYTLRPKSQEELERLTKLAWACGARASSVKLTDEKFLLYVFTNDDSFAARTMSVVAIRRGGGSREMQCISIEHPDRLFIIEDYIVTHNTFTAIKSISDIGHKVAVVLKPKYIDKWVDDFTDETKGILDISEKEIMTIQGSAELMALTKLVEIPGALDKYKIFIFSNRTFDNYLKAYELLGSDITAMGYMIEPDYLFERMGVGIRLIDEVHEEFHANFRQDLYTHVHMSISLSATLISRDPTLMRMYETAYPQATRYKAPPLERYTTSYGVYYNSNPNYRLKTSERGQSSYSHTAYESCIMNNKTFMKGYGDMIKHYLDKGFVQNYEPGHKAIVFAATIDMCTRLKDHLSDAYPQFSVRRFVTGDDYHADYQAPDIRVTTIGKGGTGLDIKNLTDAHMTNALDSIQQNIQAFGRLRNLLPKETRFFWYTNRRVPKHVKYHAKKMQLMKERALSVSNIDYMPQL